MRRMWVALLGLAATFAAPSAALALPDDRAYEQVSPADKLGYPAGGFLGQGLGLLAAPDGSRVTYQGAYPLPPSAGGGLGGFLAERAANAWTTIGLAPIPGPNQGGQGLPSQDFTPRGSTPDLDVLAYYDSTTVPYGGLWIRRADGSRQEVAQATQQPPALDVALAGGSPGQPWFSGMSDDGRHVVFTHSAALVPGIVSTGKDILYEWVDDGSNGGAGTLRAVNVTNDPTPTLINADHAELGGSINPANLAARRGTLAGNRVSYRARRAVSANGSRIFFQNPAPIMYTTGGASGQSRGGGPVYARVAGTTTVEVSAPAAGHVPTVAPTTFQYLDASRSAEDPELDGRYVFFWADGDLVAGAPATGGIYRWDSAAGGGAGGLEFVAEAPMLVAAAQTYVPSALASPDGEVLYYQNGGDLYRWSAGDGAEAIAPGLVVGGGINDTATTMQFAIGISTERCVTANVTPDGSHLAFSAKPPGAGVDVPIRVYRYSAADDQLVEVSRSSALPVNPLSSGFPRLAGCGAMNTPGPNPGRIMSDDGRYVFFDTAAALVPTDFNGRFDTYRWDAESGDSDLISTGTSSTATFFQGTDALGLNGFFMTEERLVPTDGDPVYDLYTARVGGGFEYPDDGPPCQGAACRGESSNPPVPPAIGSGGDGPGDESPLRASFSVAKPSAGQRAALARGRRIVVRVRVNRPGLVTLRARARIGGASRVVARATRTVTRAGVVHLGVRLDSRARAWLARGRALRVAIATRFEGALEPRTMSLTVRRSK